MEATSAVDEQVDDRGSPVHGTPEMIPAVGDVINEQEGMEVALKLAQQALTVGEVPVGCIFVHEGKIIASGRNTVNETRNATRHAEINCIDDVLKWCKVNNKEPSSVFANTEVFVTVEPCIMCAGALHKLHLKQITYGCHNDRFGGCGTVLDAGILADNPCKIIAGVKADEAMQLLKTFYKGTNPNAPVPNVKKKAVSKNDTSSLSS
ncbi:tRNA-specific adenosine deaminase 2 [Frankliniella fusca]|uniref:tRNA-specific adenosine deaminase 2 n=1 Tax=Frankliniella fusca TaxID=407009 RepID=A0AAE1HKJ2_9NEOP|nr:tRNA-specific adenosine deaminase 2 [Frankliniella fusca]KAK3922275.1 tRNA-specific adenosine deaminase 2 [Frankliniella fusca]